MEPTAEIASGRAGLAVSGDLLRIHSLNSKRAKKGVPLMMEFSVNPETGPFLVSSTRATMWITPRVPKVRAAFRLVDLGAFFAEVVSEVARVGEEAKWGNVHPFTPEGLVQAIGHLRSYDLDELEVLINPDTPWAGMAPVESETDGEVHRTILGFPLVEADWVPCGTVVVVPQDKDYVGFMYLFGERGVAVVHNASRGIAVCRG